MANQIEHRQSLKALENYRRLSAPSFIAAREQAQTVLGSLFNRVSFAEVYRVVKLVLLPTEEVLMSRRRGEVPNKEKFEAVVVRWSIEEKKKQWHMVLEPLEDPLQVQVMTQLVLPSRPPGVDRYTVTGEELGVIEEDVHTIEIAARNILKAKLGLREVLD